MDKRELITCVPFAPFTVSDDTVVIVVEDLNSVIVPFIKTKQPILGWTSSPFAGKIPSNSNILQTYKNILKGKKVLIVTNMAQAIELYRGHDTLLNKYISFPDVSWGPKPVIMLSHTDSSGVFHGIEIPPEYLDQFLASINVKSSFEGMYITAYDD